jgi:hypothetical protein
MEESHGCLGIPRYDEGARRQSSFYAAVPIRIKQQIDGPSDLSHPDEILILSWLHCTWLSMCQRHLLCGISFCFLVLSLDFVCGEVSC